MFTTVYAYGNVITSSMKQSHNHYNMFTTNLRLISNKRTTILTTKPGLMQQPHNRCMITVSQQVYNRFWLSAGENFRGGGHFSKIVGGRPPAKKGGNFSLDGGGVQILNAVDTIHGAVPGSRTPVSCTLTTFAIHYATALWCDRLWLCYY